MTEETQPQYPVFMMCGRDPQRRRLLEVVDPEKRYKSKALLPFLGKRLVEWQLEVLRKSPYVEGLYLLGLNKDDIQLDYPVQYIPVKTESDFADKLERGVKYLADAGKNPEMIVISSSDAPAVQRSDIDEFFRQMVMNRECEFILSFVPEEVLEAAFPQSGRVVLKFRDHQLIPGELYALSPRAITIGREVIHEISLRRRQINRQKQKINPSPVIRFLAQRPMMWLVIVKYLLGLASLGDAESAFEKTFGCKSKGVIVNSAGFGMDMDLPEDYMRLQDYLQDTRHIKDECVTKQLNLED